MREKLLKFDDLNFVLRWLEQFIRTVKGQNIFWTRMLFNLFLLVFQIQYTIRTIGIQIGKNKYLGFRKNNLPLGPRRIIEAAVLCLGLLTIINSSSQIRSWATCKENIHLLKGFEYCWKSPSLNNVDTKIQLQNQAFGKIFMGYKNILNCSQKSTYLLKWMTVRQKLDMIKEKKKVVQKSNLKKMVS